MGKIFNTRGPCFKDIHYMVNIETRADKIIKELIQQNMYFTINRARQYGKTTTLNCLYEKLKDTYSVFLLSFADMGSVAFTSEYQFCKTFLRLLRNRIMYQLVNGISQETIQAIEQGANTDNFDFQMLMDLIMHMCSSSANPVVLIIDEVDQASNNQIFLDFLSILRSMYLQRKYIKTFQSVILAGVYDIKNLKARIRPDDNRMYNSPWNVAADFNIDMSFAQQDIAGMLNEYELDHRTGMDITKISGLIYDYTSGYPFLVSRLCQLMDINTAKGESDEISAWSRDGFLEAVKLILQENNTLFDDISKKLTDSPILNNMIRSILFTGRTIPYNPDDYAINLGIMFGYFKNSNGSLIIANRIFETRLYNKYISEELTGSAISDAANLDKNQFIANGSLNMDLVMEKFMIHFNEIYGDSNDHFIEENGRRIFLTYLKPIINGVGNYYIEARTRDMRRTDVIIDYRGEQTIIEMKIWHGDEYNHRGELQLSSYLDNYGLDKGYLLSFNFNKNKKSTIKKLNCNGKTIIEVIV